MVWVAWGKSQGLCLLGVGREDTRHNEEVDEMCLARTWVAAEVRESSLWKCYGMS